MRRNPLLKAKSYLNRKVYNNRITYCFGVEESSYDPATGKIEKQLQFYNRELKCSRPHTFTDAIIDGDMYRITDLSIEIAFLDFQKVINTTDIDDELSSLRNTADENYGFDIKNDKVFFNGKEYRIKDKKPILIFADTPASFKLHLREI